MLTYRAERRLAIVILCLLVLSTFGDPQAFGVTIYVGAVAGLGVLQSVLPSIFPRTLTPAQIVEQIASLAPQDRAELLREIEARRILDDMKRHRELRQQEQERGDGNDGDST